MTAEQLVVIAAFEDEATALDALHVLQEAHREDELKFKAYAVVRRDAEKRLHVKETGDPGGAAGVASGGALGLALGLLAGPIGLAALTGALVGGIAMKFRDTGVKNDEIRAAGESLKPGMAALLVLTEEGSEDVIAEKLALNGGTVVRAALAEEEVLQVGSRTETAPAPGAGDTDTASG